MSENQQKAVDPGPDPQAEEKPEVLPEVEAPAASAQSESASLEQKLAEANKLAEDNRELYLRTAAELENFRRRAAREMENVRRYGIEKIAQEILIVRDSLEMGLEAATEKADVKSLLEGKQNTLRQLDQLMERFDISEVNPLGEQFDPEFQEAIATQPTSEHPPGSVIEVVQKGYRISDRLLRPARVLIAREPEAQQDKNSSQGPGEA